MNAPQTDHRNDQPDITKDNGKVRHAVGYIRVSTDMQAKDEQMVGRGLRGPKNGGTDSCLVLDVQDDELPQGIMSYGRVLELWDK